MDQIYRINKLIEKIESEFGAERNKKIGEKWNIPDVKYLYAFNIPVIFTRRLSVALSGSYLQTGTG